MRTPWRKKSRQSILPEVLSAALQPRTAIVAVSWSSANEIAVTFNTSAQFAGNISSLDLRFRFANGFEEIASMTGADQDVGFYTLQQPGQVLISVQWANESWLAVGDPGFIFGPWTMWSGTLPS